MRIVSSGVAILSLIISRKWLGGLSLNAPQNKSRQCPDSEIRNISISPFSEFRNRKDTSNVLIPSVVLVSKFARRSISECGELRNHDTSEKLVSGPASLEERPPAAIICSARRRTRAVPLGFALCYSVQRLPTPHPVSSGIWRRGV